MAGSTECIMIYFVRGLEAKAAAGAVVEPGGDLGTLPLSEELEIRALRQVLANQAIGVLIGPPFPGMVGSGEVEAGAEESLDLLVAMELGSVVGGDGMDGMRFVRQELDGALGGMVCGGARELADAHQAAFAFDDRDDAGLAATMDCIGFPVAAAGPSLHHGGPLGDEPLARETAAAVVAAVPFASEFAGPAQVAPQRAAPRPVVPDVQIEGLVTHHRQAEPTAPPDNLFRTPAFAQQALQRPEVPPPVTCIAPRAAPPRVGLLNRHHRAIEPVVRPIALQFPMDRGPVSSQTRRNRSDRHASRPQRSDMISILGR